MSGLFKKPEEPDTGFPDSGGWTDRLPLDNSAPDTEPTLPGALDGLPPSV